MSNAHEQVWVAHEKPTFHNNSSVGRGGVLGHRDATLVHTTIRCVDGVDSELQGMERAAVLHCCGIEERVGRTGPPDGHRRGRNRKELNLAPQSKGGTSIGTRLALSDGHGWRCDCRNRRIED